MSRTLSGLFLVGALNKPKKEEKDESGKSPDHRGAIRENPGKIGKVPKRIKRTKKEGQVQIGKHPRLKHPRLAALGANRTGEPRPLEWTRVDAFVDTSVDAFVGRSWELSWGVLELIGRREKNPHPQDKIQHVDFTKDTRPLYYKTPPCAFYHKNVRSKAVFGP